MILSKTGRPRYNLLIDSNVIKESADGEMLALIVDNKLSFKKHIAKLSKTATYHAFRKCLTLKKASILGNVFVDSQLNYAPLIWMFCKKNFFKMQKVHHERLRVIYQSDESHKNLLNSDHRVFYIKDTNGFWSLKFLRVCLRQIPSLCELILLVKTYHII